MTDPIINLSGYKFIQLNNLQPLQSAMLAALQTADVVGTILLAPEGINVALAGPSNDIRSARDWFATEPLFHDIWFKESVSTFAPFSKLKVRVRPEIIAFDGGKTRPLDRPAPNLAPAELKKWLNENRDFILLDTRNNYETDAGTFCQAQKLDLENFRDFPQAVAQLGAECQSKPLVTFCTGGIRCEKAASWLLDNGFTEVYQMEGGILNYLEQCDGSHWKGDCFVFDDRVKINTSLAETGGILCSRCFRAASKSAQQQRGFAADDNCADCQLARTRLDSA